MGADESIPSSADDSQTFQSDSAYIGGDGNVRWVYSDGTATDQDIHDAFDSLPSNRDYQATVYLIGEFKINKSIHPPSYTYINGHNAILKPGTGLSAGNYLIDERTERDGTVLNDNQAKQQVMIDGIYIDGESGPYDGIRTWGNGGGGTAQDYEEFRHGLMHARIRGCDNFNGLNIGTRRGYYYDLQVANCDARGINMGSGSGDSVVIDAHVEEVTGNGWEIRRGFVHLFRPIAQDCGGKGFVIGKSNNSEVKQPRIYGGYTEFNDDVGMEVLDGVTGLVIHDMSVISNCLTTGSSGVVTNQARGVFSDLSIYDNQGTPTQTIGMTVGSNATGVKLRDLNFAEQPGTDVTDNGTGTVRQIGLESPQDVSGSRSRGTWYQNTTGFPLIVSFRHVDGSGGRTWADAHVNESTSNRVVLSNSDAGDGSNASKSGLYFAVAPGDYYKINASGETDWYEQQLGQQW